ncbi:Helicase associated domain protein [Kitasatospora sp. NPDC088346]|uniref:helicase associated domain-containing protein n=1 Tax=Kitasatospora sp. NPDC088346 TaxID=3364073 RepID=UPI00380A28E4
MQIAVLRAVADLELRRVITFHSRVAAAREFATTMAATAELLPAADRPERVTALAVAGSDKLKDRAAFATFTASTGERPGEEGEECCIICNSRLLNEGIDVAAVDAIVFADPKSSVIDVVQAVGWALRQSYRQGKVSWVIIPVYLPTPAVGDDSATTDPAEVREAADAVKAEADDEIEASSFRTIWRVLRALAAHDARVVGRITELRTKRAGEKDTTAVSEAGEDSGEAGDVGQPASESPVEWLRINARKHAAQILQTVKLRAFNPRATEWQRMHRLAAAFRARHGHLDASDKAVDGDLVSWLDRQRYLKGAGLLAAARVNELDQLDMIWDKHAHSWERGFAHARAWAALHGHLAIPAAEKLDGHGHGHGHGVGGWMGRQRKNTKLTAAQDAKLTALDAMWRIEPDWNRSYRRLLAYLAAGGTLDGPANRTGGEADPTFRPGAWLRKQAGARADGKLSVQQTVLLDALAAAEQAGV